MAETGKNKEAAGNGKGRPTPPRKIQEAARIKPVVGNKNPEAMKAARAKELEARRRAREGMMRGEEKYLTARDKGPQKRLARNLVDCRLSVGEFVMPMLFAIIIVTFFITDLEVLNNINTAMLIFMLAVVADATILALNVKRQLARKFGADKLEKGLIWYVIIRAVQLRQLRIPKPEVKIGRIRQQ